MSLELAQGPIVLDKSVTGVGSGDLDYTDRSTGPQKGSDRPALIDLV